MSHLKNEITLPHFGYRLWATYNPNAKPPTRFVTMASCLFEKRERVEAYRHERECEQEAKLVEMPENVRVDFLDRFGRVLYEIRGERPQESIILGEDDFWTKLK